MPNAQAQIKQALRDQEGWWVRAVLSTFDGIARDFRYEVEKVRMHFRGNHVWYRGSTYRIALNSIAKQACSRVNCGCLRTSAAQPRTRG